MIVKIAAGYYLLNAALALLSLLLGPFDFMSMLMTVIFAGLFGAMGFGLLQRAKWARLMALGCSLLGWTLGTLLLIGILGYLLIVAKLTAVVGILAGMALLPVLLWIVGVVISFKLFWHLCSPEGCEEFGEPPISAPTVVASAGAWLGLVLVNFVATGGGQFMHEIAVSSASRDTDEKMRRAALIEAERERALRDGEARRAAARAQSEAETGARLEATQTEEAMSPEAVETADGVADAEAAANSPGAAAPESPEASAVPDTPEATTQPPPTEQQAAPEAPATNIIAPAADSGDAPASRKIVKCRDKSGGVTFTQGYCPPGTRQVDMTE